MSINPNQTSALGDYQIPKNVYTAIQNAAAKTGVNFSYLVKKAAVESSFDPNAKAKTSSATGLYQFIDKTWLGMIHDFGDKYGLSKYANKIDDNGHVATTKDKREILNLRKDPEISSIMAAEFDRSNYQQLKDTVGGDIGSTELYMAHFLGAGSAAGFLNAMKKSPDMTAADLFPREARANRNVFYDSKTGQPRSLSEVYAFFDNKLDGVNTDTDTTGTTNFAANQDTVLRNPQSAQAANQIYTNDESPFIRLASLMNTGTAMRAQSTLSSMMRFNGAGDADKTQTQTAQNGNWQILPPSLYGKLSLSPAQMMLLSDFNT